ncbi:uncharacterized protein LOC111259817 isoform X1 [Varroa jacobsoni]|uniref:uncharacterized protein LOC111259817 isoform X1 n=2 Tax=Varroa jacobsoni TaxID=62625 RepID=UPI000BF7B9D9|nr:uncharacterized protein LOC111259817 isoform X1 [Varroa jacobsoni]
MKEPAEPGGTGYDYLSYEDESSSHGDIEIMEIVTNLRSSKFIELDVERRRATSEEELKFLRRTAEEPANSSEIKTFKKWTNSFTLGLAMSREIKMMSPQAQIDISTPSRSRSTISDEQQQLLSFEDENSTKGENTLLEATAHVRADKSFELISERRPASASEIDHLRTTTQVDAGKKLWQQNVVLGDVCTREVTVRRDGPEDVTSVLSACSAVDFATILRDLEEDRKASQLEEYPFKSRWTCEDKAQSRDMAIILLSRYNPQSLIQLNGPKKKGTPVH